MDQLTKSKKNLFFKSTNAGIRANIIVLIIKRLYIPTFLEIQNITQN